MVKTPFHYINLVNFSSVSNWSASSLLAKSLEYNDGLKVYRVGDLIQRSKERIIIEDTVTYRRVTIRLYGNGITLRDEVKGNDIGTKRQFLISTGQFIMSKIDARNGAFGIVPESLEGAVVTQDFLTYDINTEIVVPEFFIAFISTQEFLSLCQRASSGTTGRQRIDENAFLDFEIPVPSLSRQRRLVRMYQKRNDLGKSQEQKAESLLAEVTDILLETTGISVDDKSKKRGLNVIRYKQLAKWSVDFILRQQEFPGLRESKFPIVHLGDIIEYFQYGISAKANTERRGTPMLRMNNIKDGQIDLEDIKHFDFESNDVSKEKMILQKHDLLFNRTNSKELVGKSAVFALDGEFTFASYLIRVRFNDAVNAYYVSYILNSQIGRRQIDSLSRQVLGQANINSEELREIRIPLPESKVQDRIVARLNRLITERSDLLGKSKRNKFLAIKEFEDFVFTN